MLVNNYCCKGSTLVDRSSFKNFCDITTFHQVARVTSASFQSSLSTTTHGTAYSVVRKKDSCLRTMSNPFSIGCSIYTLLTILTAPRSWWIYLVKWSLRNCRSLRDLLDLPLVKTKCGQTSFKFVATWDWNTLPRDLQVQDTCTVQTNIYLILDGHRYHQPYL